MKTIHSHKSKYNGTKYRLVQYTEYNYKIQYYNERTKSWRIYNHLSGYPFDTAKSLYCSIYVRGYYHDGWGKLDKEHILKVKQAELELFGAM